ncbi:hypothetical protein B4109_0304 [Geobacillus stearothermophilus]|uniref:Uncharacterized protein n=1 Tax=Geobacillus stearothermophilus TaxID=1422 RepID=A0A150MIF0_GEOSE|nr:hypothetical protein B4109_0304 [Geobacillus stearothermophilus]
MFTLADELVQIRLLVANDPKLLKQRGERFFRLVVKRRFHPHSPPEST